MRNNKMKKKLETGIICTLTFIVYVLTNNYVQYTMYRNVVAYNISEQKGTVGLLFMSIMLPIISIWELTKMVVRLIKKKKKFLLDLLPFTSIFGFFIMFIFGVYKLIRKKDIQLTWSFSVHGISLFLIWIFFTIGSACLLTDILPKESLILKVVLYVCCPICVYTFGVIVADTLIKWQHKCNNSQQ